MPWSNRLPERPWEIAAAVIEDQKKVEQALKEAKMEMEHAWMLARQVFEMNPSPLVVIDEWGKMVIASPAFIQLMGIPPDKVEGREIFRCTNRIPERTRLLQKVSSAMEKWGFHDSAAI
jgi:PAS domain-containing protein